MIKNQCASRLLIGEPNGCHDCSRLFASYAFISILWISLLQIKDWKKWRKESEYKQEKIILLIDF